MKATCLAVGVLVLLIGFAPAQATITMEMVAVGNPGNAPDVWGDNSRQNGAVAYNYSIGKYEVTAEQYTFFLDAVAKDDTNNLYSPSMSAGCGIQRTGTAGDFSYSVSTTYANRPVTSITWGDALRFINWLNNGQPTGAQTASTTEDGAYTLAGNGNAALNGTDASVEKTPRNANAKYALPTYDEWYKAAYYDPNKGGPGVGGYWATATGSDTMDSSRANFDTGSTTNVGQYAPSPYGTYDQAGNAWEWIEAPSPWWQKDGDGNLISRISAGGAYNTNAFYATAGPCFNFDHQAMADDVSMGFRVVSFVTPEPATMVLLALGGLFGLRRRKH
jgi:formylglycine-generating enzyme required for sulfatase activity